jgi:hypothetical protein
MNMTPDEIKNWKAKRKEKAETGFPKTINEVEVFAPQDPSVGLFACYATVNLHGFEVDDAEELSLLRETLANAFDEIYNDNCTVAFEWENVD